jgi:hypothetical protein
MKCYKCGNKIDKNDYAVEKKSGKKICGNCYEKPFLELEEKIKNERINMMFDITHRFVNNNYDDGDLM